MDSEKVKAALKVLDKTLSSKNRTEIFNIDKAIIIRAMISYGDAVGKERAIDFMEWYGEGKTNLRITSDAYDEWQKLNQQL